MPILAILAEDRGAYTSGMVIDWFPDGTSDLGAMVNNPSHWRIIETDLPKDECDILISKGVSETEFDNPPRREFMLTGPFPDRNPQTAIDAFISSSDILAMKTRTPRD